MYTFVHRNNNAGCDWDKGDCCGSTGNPDQKKYCKKCQCRDCTYSAKKDECSGKEIKGKCGNTYVGELRLASHHCMSACCVFTLVFFCRGVVAGDSVHAENAGDGVCDDVNNNAGCNWDKGDCCGASKVFKKPYW